MNVWYPYVTMNTLLIILTIRYTLEYIYANIISNKHRCFANIRYNFTYAYTISHQVIGMFVVLPVREFPL